MLGEATLDVLGTFLGEAIRFPIQIAALHTTELGARFRQIATTEGVPTAVRWRSAQFEE